MTIDWQKIKTTCLNPECVFSFLPPPNYSTEWKHIPMISKLRIHYSWFNLLPPCPPPSAAAGPIPRRLSGRLTLESAEGRQEFYKFSFLQSKKIIRKCVMEKSRKGKLAYSLSFGAGYQLLVWAVNLSAAEVVEYRGESLLRRRGRG